MTKRVLQVALEAPCAVAEMSVADSAGNGSVTLVGIGSGCMDLTEHLAILAPPDTDMYRMRLKLDRPSLSTCVDQTSPQECLALAQHPGEALWEATVGWWEFSSHHLGGSYARTRKAPPACTEVYDTLVEPAAFSNVRAQGEGAVASGMLGPAVLKGPECKGPDWDRPPGQQVLSHCVSAPAPPSAVLACLRRLHHAWLSMQGAGRRGSGDLTAEGGVCVGRCLGTRC